MKITKRKSKRKQSIRESMIRTAEALEKQAENIPEDMNLREEDMDILFGRICTQLVQEEAEQKEKQSKPSKRTKLTGWKKWSTIAAAACVSIFVLAVRGEAMKLYLMTTVQELFGENTVKELTDNDKDREISDLDFYEAREKIQEELNVEVPEFFYLPEGFIYSGYYIDQKNNMANLCYEQAKTVFQLYILGGENDKTIGNTYEVDGERVEQISLNDEEEEITIYKIYGEDPDIYIAKWKYKNIKYEIYAPIELEELKKILKNMWF